MACQQRACSIVSNRSENTYTDVWWKHQQDPQWYRYARACGNTCAGHQERQSVKCGTVLHTRGKITTKNSDGSQSTYVHVNQALAPAPPFRAGSRSLLWHSRDPYSGGTLTTGSHLHYEETTAFGTLVPTSTVLGYGR